MAAYSKGSVGAKVSRGAMKAAEAAWRWSKGPGRQLATVTSIRILRRVRANLTARRVVSFPHLVVLVWLVILLWGERWIFDSRVAECDWQSWERWPKGATPHHLVLVADPQIVDPHTYPGRPWPLSSLTVAVTDAYLYRGFKSLQTRLHPDSLFFLGDLFDGGREWKTLQGRFVDPQWGLQRSGAEKKQLRTWHRRYGESYWQREYRRFGRIFFDSWNAGGSQPGAWQRGRKLVASLPGNHDVGFGAMVQVPVRDRFEAFFGEGNRVDIVGNHSVVSVDTVSLSADSSRYREDHDLSEIYGPVTKFLERVQTVKGKLVQEELNFWYGLEQGRRVMKHVVEEVEDIDGGEATTSSSSSSSSSLPDFPTILLTHVPLYRPPGTPCGPKRERWPPSKPPPGQTTVNPDERNAISVHAGYQYQNVLDEGDSARLVASVGNVVHVFSGDDHDYCEVIHPLSSSPSSASSSSPSAPSIREITVKSMSMAMGVSNPGFLMVSLYNPVDAQGRSLPGTPAQTLQTHLCILPNQMHTYARYLTLGLVSLAILALRAFLVPVLRLTPFALEPEHHPQAYQPRKGSVLPLHEDKREPPDGQSSATARAFAAPRHGSRRWQSTAPQSYGSTPRWESKPKARGRWGGIDDSRGPRITLDQSFYKMAPARTDGRSRLRVVAREMWTTSWRVVWMTLVLWVYLMRG